VVQLARIFKLEAVVEGIEDETYLKRLKDSRCDFGQGFYFAKPLSAEEVMTVEARQSHMVATGFEPASSRQFRRDSAARAALPRRP
jgi:sensor c-di-GMP phosphodiesterase-like protein